MVYHLERGGLDQLSSWLIPSNNFGGRIQLSLPDTRIWMVAAQGTVAASKDE